MNTEAKPLIAIVCAQGTNCHEETQWAIKQAGGDGVIILLQDLLGNARLTKYQGLIIPGGFSWGDHLAAGRIEAIHLVYRLKQQMEAFVSEGKPILGICNGFQVLIETGLLPQGEFGKQQLVLRQNNSARFEHRFVSLQFEKTNSFWTNGLDGRILTIPVAHAEGRMFIPDKSDATFQIACQYATADGQATEQYPLNPNGSPAGIAGIINPTGLIFGLMPHPERATETWQCSTDGLSVFSNLVSYLS